MACTRALPKMTGRFEETHHDRSWSLASCRGLRPGISGGRICPVSSAPTDPDAGGAGPGDFAAPAAPAPVGPPRRDGDAGRSSRRLPLLLLPGDDADDARAWRGRRPARPGAASGRSAAWPRPRPSRPRPPELGTKPAMSAAPSGLQPVRPGLPTPRPVARARQNPFLRICRSDRPQRPAPHPCCRPPGRASPASASAFCWRARWPAPVGRWWLRAWSPTGSEWSGTVAPGRGRDTGRAGRKGWLTGRAGWGWLRCSATESSRPPPETRNGRLRQTEVTGSATCIVRSP